MLRSVDDLDPAVAVVIRGMARDQRYGITEADLANTIELDAETRDQVGQLCAWLRRREARIDAVLSGWPLATYFSLFVSMLVFPRGRVVIPIAVAATFFTVRFSLTSWGDRIKALEAVCMRNPTAFLIPTLFEWLTDPRGFPRGRSKDWYRQVVRVSTELLSEDGPLNVDRLTLRRMRRYARRIERFPDASPEEGHLRDLILRHVVD